MKKELNESILIEFDIADYEPWQGAVEVWDKIVNNEKVDEFEILLKDMTDGAITLTTINDLLWFEGDWVLTQLGIED